MDTPEKCETNRWNARYFRMCGTCKYKEFGICKNENSLLACELVSNNDTCDLWTEKNLEERISSYSKMYEK